MKGDPRAPFTLEDCVERFMAWAAAAARPLPAADLERFVALVERIQRDLSRQREQLESAKN